MRFAKPPDLAGAARIERWLGAGPFKYIAYQILNAPGVRTTLRRVDFRIVAGSVDHGALRVEFIAPWKQIGLAAIPRGVFPLLLGRKPVHRTVTLRTPCSKCFHVIGVDEPDRQLLLARDRLFIYPVDRERSVIRGFYEIEIFRVRDLGLVHRESLHRNRMFRTFVLVAAVPAH